MSPLQRKFLHDTTKDKIDKAAYTKALIVRGEYDWSGTEWEGKKPPRHNDGTFRAPTKILLRAGGWSETNTSALSNLSCEYFRERFNYHMQRLDGGFKKALAEITGDGKALELLSAKLYDSLMADLEDEERARRIPFKDRANLYQTLTEMDAKIKGDTGTRDHQRQGPSIGGIVQVINNNVGDTAEGRKMLSDLASVHEDVMDIVEGVVEVADSDG